MDGYDTFGSCRGSQSMGKRRMKREPLCLSCAHGSRLEDGRSTLTITRFARFCSDAQPWRARRAVLSRHHLRKLSSDVHLLYTSLKNPPHKYMGLWWWI